MTRGEFRSTLSEEMLSALLTSLLAFYFPLDSSIAIAAALHLLLVTLRLPFARAYPTPRFSNLDLALLVAFTVLGAFTLRTLAQIPLMTFYTVGGKIFALRWIGLVVGALWIVRAAAELRKVQSESPLPTTMRVRAVVMGFFGGLSGGYELRAPWLALSLVIVRLAAYATWIPSPLRGLGRNPLGLGIIVLGILASIGLSFRRKDFPDELRRSAALALAGVSIAILLGWND